MNRVVMSYPKCGRTWLRLFFTYYGVTEPIIFLHHDSLFKKYCKDKRTRRILLIRNPHDVMVSYFFESTVRSNKRFKDISEFIRNPQTGIHIYKRNADKWKRNRNQVIVHYEELFDCVWERILSHFELPVDHNKINRVHELCSFDSIKNNMNKIAELPNAWRYLPRKRKKIKPYAKDPRTHKFRRGKINGYVDYLNQKDIDYITSVWEK